MKYGAYIIGCTDCGEEVCAASGRISTQSGTALEIFERSHDKEKNKNLITHDDVLVYDIRYEVPVLRL